ncbi:uncharacterized protein OCT59_018968 [Rhizophagus irregularis]|nr:hypothetical protein OCT59_027151 [Rhizophagus irregularis]UZO26754.1 hypothetical protein OCT59_018968 [Rhizophagus irregularis]
MAENLTCNYLPGICYICQKCLRCFKLPQENPCKCQKDKISRVKKPLHGQQIYQRAYTTNQIFPKLNNFLLDINTKFGYNNNFEKNFSYTTCSACNSKLQRLKTSDKKSQLKSNKKSNRKAQINNEEIISIDDLPTENSKRKVGSYNNKKENEKDNDNEIEDEGDDDKDFNNKDDDYYDKDSDVNDENYEEDDDNGDYDEESDNDNKKYEEVDIIEEIKIQLVVKNNNIKIPTAKTLTIRPASYKNFTEKINLATKKILEKETKSKYSYTISYKAVNARGPSNTLEDKLDFQEFISEYQKHSDDNIRSSSEEIEIQTKKKKKSRSLREDDLSKEEKRRSEVIADLVEMYKCDLHSTPCFIQDGRHLQLNPSRLQLWAREIINKGTTYDIPPSYPVFDMKSSVFINKNNSATQMQNSQTSNTPTPIFIQLPSQVYQNPTNTHLELPSSSKLPSIGEFLNNLDLKYNCNNIYAKFEDAFLEEEITVNAIKDLTDEQLQKLGVVKIGWQKNIKQAAQQY